MTAHPYRMRKRFGQHFLCDPAVVQHILDCLDLSPGRTVFEIGPGRGALTEPLLQRLQRLQVVEIDRDLAAALQAQYGAGGRLLVHCRDVLKFDFCAACDGPALVLGNLPYNISTPLLFRLLGQLHCIEEMVFMLQKEVAGRLCAQPGTRDYGRLSVMVQTRCRAEPLFEVPPQAFNPPPRVQSSVLRLTPDPQAPAITDRRLHAELVRTAFSHRRKTLRNALQERVQPAQLTALGLDPQARPETLSVSDYAALANAVAAARGPEPR